MRILALDTATEACSVALLTDDGISGHCREVGRGHAEEILGMVDATLAEAGISLGSVNAIAASVGPGSFTGVRICVSVAQGLAFGAGLPVIPVTTLEALALQAIRAGADHVLACLDARMGEIYWGCFSAGTAPGRTSSRGLIEVGPPVVGTASSVRVPFTGEYHGMGRGFAAYPALATRAGIVLTPGACEALPDARYMAELGAARFAEGLAVDAGNLAPRYLRDKVARTELERGVKGGS